MLVVWGCFELVTKIIQEGFIIARQKLKIK